MLDKKMLENHKAFFFLNGKLKPVKKPSIVPLEDLVGIERQKKLLLKNTRAFVEGKPVNDVLLWGKRGTGKSSLVRAMLGLFDNLRLLQIDKDEVGFLFDFFDQAEEFPQYKFLVLIDDLTITTEEGKVIRLLKTLLDGSVLERPQNVVIYATSNRKNLAPDTYLEREYKFPKEEIEERFSLVDRFGLKIGFVDFSPADYLRAVEIYCQKFGLPFNENLKKEALKFAAEKELSGRTALQFVKFALINMSNS